MKTRNSSIFFKYLFTITLLFVAVAISAQQNQLPQRSKLSPVLQSQKRKADDKQEFVFIVSVKNQKLFNDSIQKIKGVQIINAYEPAGIFFIKTTHGVVNQIAGWDNVLFIDISRKPIEELFSGTIDGTTNAINKMQSAYPQYNGSSITIGIKENNFDTVDIDFKGRYADNPAASQNVTGHASIMGTIAAGGGNTWYATKGAAWGSRIVSSSFTNLLPDANSFFQQYGITVQNHSYGTGIENYYGNEAVAYDLFAVNNPSILHVFSSGNSGNQTLQSGTYGGLNGYANLTGNFKMAKNILTVGATDSFYIVAPLSSKGPGYDGRIKPELVALGEDGSSGAAAIVSGVSAALQQAYKNLNGGNAAPSSLIKAVIINGADDVGNAGPDYKSGFGSVNAYAAMKTIASGNYFSGSVAQAQQTDFNLNIPAGIKKIKFTLVWNDPPATVNAGNALVNDLDIELITPAAQVIHPWVLSVYPHIDSLNALAQRKRDGVNNIEQISFDNPVAGSYIIRVKGFTVTGNQSFSFAWQNETAENFEWYYPTQNDPVLAGEQNVLRWRSNLSASTGNLQYSIDGVNWQAVANNINLSTGYFKWNAPSIYSKAVFRMTAGNNYSTDTFIISKPLPISVGFNCPDSFMLYWPKMNGVNRYSVYNLPGNYLTAYRSVTDTSILIYKNPDPGLHFAVAPNINNREGVKSFAFNYTTQGTGCFIRAFYASKTSNSAQLHLELGTLYGIQKIVLQKIRNADTVVLQTVNNPSQLIFDFTDNALKSGLQLYRVYLETSGGTRIYSDIAPLYFAESGSLFVFPNPVKKGEPATVVMNESNTGELQLTDMFGRILQRWPVATDLITIPTGRLLAGVYLLRLATEDDKINTGRLIVY